MSNKYIEIENLLIDEAIEYLKLPFDEAIEYFKKKTLVPTETYQSLQIGMHHESFVVAGANRDDMVKGFYLAVKEAIEQGHDKEWFENQFDIIVEKTGWKDRSGNPGWRADIIMDTNWRSAFAVGSWKQDQDPILLEAYPYRRIRTREDLLVRGEHKKWNRLTLPQHDAFWDNHSTPLGYGCRCWEETITIEEYDKMSDKFKVPPADEFHQVLNKETGVMETLIVGLDRGFGLSPKDFWEGKYKEKF